MTAFGNTVTATDPPSSATPAQQAMEAPVADQWTTRARRRGG